MTTWIRANVATICGYCRDVIKVGAPMLVIELDARIKTGRRRKVRCQECAGGQAPPDLPPMILTRAPGAPLAMARFAPGMLPLTFKREREPGEDG